MKRMNIHSMNDEEAGSMNSLVLYFIEVFLFRRGHSSARTERVLLPTNWLIFPRGSLATILQVKNLQD